MNTPNLPKNEGPMLDTDIKADLTLTTATGSVGDAAVTTTVTDTTSQVTSEEVKPVVVQEKGDTGKGKVTPMSEMIPSNWDLSRDVDGETLIAVNTVTSRRYVGTTEGFVKLLKGG